MRFICCSQQSSTHLTSTAVHLSWKLPPSCLPRARLLLVLGGLSTQQVDEEEWGKVADSTSCDLMWSSQYQYLHTPSPLATRRPEMWVSVCPGLKGNGFQDSSSISTVETIVSKIDESYLILVKGKTPSYSGLGKSQDHHCVNTCASVCVSMCSQKPKPEARLTGSSPFLGGATPKSRRTNRKVQSELTSTWY